MTPDIPALVGIDLTVPVPGCPRSPPLLTTEHALFLDFDGTLVALADHPDHIVVPDFLQDLLISLDRWLDGALAIVTGRRLESLDSFLAPLKLRAAGVHGAQLRHQPTIEPPEMFTLGDLALRLAARFAGDPQVWTEDKREAVAVHYRQAPEREQEILAAVAEIVTADDLEIIAGNCVFEVRRRGTGKDAAVRWLMSGRPFRDRIPVFVGDDRTDEDGIREVQRQAGSASRSVPLPARLNGGWLRLRRCMNGWGGCCRSLRALPAFFGLRSNVDEVSSCISQDLPAPTVL